MVVTFSFGENVKNKFSLWISSAILKVRREGQGAPGKKRCVLFPKLVFLYVDDYHGEGKEYEWLFDESIATSSKAMYPDTLSLSGDSTVAKIYKKYGKIVSPMGCRAFLSIWFKEGGMYPAHENDEPVFVSRFNIGAISLHLPLIYQEAKTTGKDFYELLDYYLEMIRGLHIRTYNYLGEMKASTNPLAFCEGGLYGGNLKPEDKIAPCLESATASFGITALNELQQLHNQCSLLQDNSFAKEVMTHINGRIEEFKKQDKRLYATYATPAESLVGLQVQQFRKRFGIIENVSDREYMSNGFHLNVRENITGVQKQDKEKEFWDFFDGGKIQYVKYPLGYNQAAMKILVRRAMELGFYEGINLDLSFCNVCGHKEDKMPEECPHCGSDDIIRINRMNGYLSYTRINKESRLNDNKVQEIVDRVSM